MTKGRIVGWQKLNATCKICGKDRADITFTIQGGKFLGSGHESYHWRCLPANLKVYQENSEAAMWATAQTPPGS